MPAPTHTGEKIRRSFTAPTPRTIAIGDIDVHSRAVAGLPALVEPRPRDTLVLLGDYVSRGPDSRNVLQAVIDLRRHCQVVALRGNHEEMLIDARNDPESLAVYVAVGGDAGLVSP